MRLLPEEAWLLIISRLAHDARKRAADAHTAAHNDVQRAFEILN